MMKKMFVLFALMTLVSTNTACIDDGEPLPTEETPDAATPPPDMPDADVPTPDACPPTEDMPDATVPVVPDGAVPAPTLNLTALPTTINVGDSSTVSWTSANTTSCSSSGGAQPTNGSWLVYPTTTTTYTLTCSGPGGSVTKSVTVTVNVPSPAPTLSFTASPTTITSGQSSTLSWSTTNATSCQALASWTGSKPVSGTMVVNPTMNASYLLTCTGPGGSVSELVSVTVNAPQAAPTVNFVLTPGTITVGQTSTLSWTTTNATGCVLSGGQFGGGVAFVPNWDVTVAPTTSTNYWLECQGPGGQVGTSATLIVNDDSCQCNSASDCNDGYSWTGDACDGNTRTCVHWATDCGGMQVRPGNAATCQFWGGFGGNQPAPTIGGLLQASSLPTGPSGGDWKAAPAHACSVICYNPGLGTATIDIQTEWNGVGFQHQQFNGVHTGTWDGLHNN